MGGISLLAGLARAGTLAELFSKPMRVGYLNGLAIVVLVGQLPKLCGFSTTAHGLGEEVQSFVRGLSEGKTVPASLLIGLATLVAILALRFWLPKVPGVFLAVVGATGLVSAFDLSAHGVAVLGVIPSGFPKASVPRIGLHDAATLALAALGMAFVMLADTSALSRSLAAKRGVVSTKTRNWWRSEPPIWPPASSKDSPSARPQDAPLSPKQRYAYAADRGHWGRLHRGAPSARPRPVAGPPGVCACGDCHCRCPEAVRHRDPPLDMEGQEVSSFCSL